MQIEQDLLQEETHIPVFFAEETDTLLEIVEDIQQSGSSDEAASGFEGLHKNLKKKIKFIIDFT